MIPAAYEDLLTATNTAILVNPGADGGKFDAPGARRVNVTIVPTRVIEH